VAFAALVGCGGGGGGGGGGGSTGTGGTGAVACPSGTGTGTLSIRITGTPTGTGDVTLATGQTITASSDIPLPAGPVSLTAWLTEIPGTLVRTAYTPAVDNPAPCLSAGQTTIVNVAYSLIDTSGQIWTGLANGPTTATMLAFDPTRVATSGVASANVGVDAHGSDGFAFDPFGDLWVTGATVSDPGVARYPSTLYAGGPTPVPDLTLDSPVFSGGSPGAKVLAFDTDLNLWVAVVWAGKVVKFGADQLTTSGSKSPAVEQSGFNAPAGIAFDAYGNLWVASNGDDTVVRVDKSHLATSGRGADLTITAISGGVVASTLAAPLGIAFDGYGNLWVNYEGVIAQLPASALAGTGTLTVNPPVQLVTDPSALPTGIAFDDQGGLWLAYTAGTIARFDPSQLTGQGPATPATIVGSDDIGASGSAGWMAIYPAPVFTPLASAIN
jgi:sugar lactone lactonase YvrE